jgi:hypothetical protein
MNKLISFFIFTLLLVLVQTTQANAQSYWNRGPQEFPARVRAIVTSNGNLIDSTNSATWGRWSVSFPATHPIAYLESNNDCPNCTPFRIRGLVCRNDAIGSRDCTMSFLFMEGGYGRACFLFMEGGFEIKCPREVQFE